MDIKEMEERGVMDNFLELRSYITQFLNENYPLSQDDMRSILQGTPTDNVIKRQETSRFLNEAMDEILSNAAERNDQIIAGANQGKYTPFSVEDAKREIFEQKQKMLEILREKQHSEEQLQNGDGVTTNEQNETPENLQEGSEPQEHVQGTEKADSEQTGQQLVDGVVEQSQAMDIRSGEISDGNKEIKQTEMAYQQFQQQPQQNIDNSGMNIGE